MALLPALPLLKLTQIVMMVLTNDIDALAPTRAAYLGVTSFACASVGCQIGLFGCLSAVMGAWVETGFDYSRLFYPALLGWIGGFTLGAGLVLSWECRKILAWSGKLLSRRRHTTSSIESSLRNLYNVQRALRGDQLARTNAVVLLFNLAERYHDPEFNTLMFRLIVQMERGEVPTNEFNSAFAALMTRAAVILTDRRR